MKKHLVATFIITLSPFILVSCVSTLLKEKAPTFSSEIKYVAPAAPFVVLNYSVYPSWKNRKTGNVLSVFSDCQPGNTISLPELQRYIEDSIDDTKKLSENSSSYQAKPALTRVIQGQVEGNPIQIKSTSFKRLNCGYVVSLSGKPDQLQLDENAFDHFMKSLTFK